MGQDEIIQEVRAIREDLAARHDYDVRALYEEAKRREREGGRKVIQLEPRRIEETTERSV